MAHHTVYEMTGDEIIIMFPYLFGFFWLGFEDVNEISSYCFDTFTNLM